VVVVGAVVEGSVVADGGGDTHPCVVDVATSDVLVDEVVVVSGSVVVVVEEVLDVVVDIVDAVVDVLGVVVVA
jgi:hypothetical protein